MCGERTEGIAGLEGEGLLDGMDWGEVVVFDFAELEEAVETRGLALVAAIAQYCENLGLQAYFSHILGT